MRPEQHSVRVVAQRTLLHSFFRVEEADLRHPLPDGSLSPLITRQVVERGDSVAALVYHTELDELLFTRQFRFPTVSRGIADGQLTELVAGKLAPDEAPEDCLRRELVEELGYEAKSVQHLYTFFASPGGLSEQMYLFYAEIDESSKVEAGGGLASEHEYIQPVWLAASEVQARLSEFQDAKTLIGLQWWLLHRAR